MRALALLVPFVAVAALAQTQWIHPFDYPQTGNEPGEAWLVIEIPQGSVTKYELDKKTGIPVVNRFQEMPVAYPANYGCFPSTLAGDGDNLDALVFTREPLMPGCMIKVRIVGVLPMIDGGDQDDKLIAVPVSDVDSTYDNIQDIGDIAKSDLDRMSAFFRVYKQLPEGRKTVELKPIEDKAAAMKIYDSSLKSYQANKIKN